MAPKSQSEASTEIMGISEGMHRMNLPSGVLKEYGTTSSTCTTAAGFISDITYSSEELEVMRVVRRRLEKDHGLSYVNPRFLAYTVIASKNRVDEATDKYRKFLQATALCDMDIVEPDDILLGDPAVADQLVRAYAPTGVDHEGRQIMWISGGSSGVEKDMEKSAIRAGILYTMAVHADQKSLREGITFVVDTSKHGTMEKIGNESKLQTINKSYPLRPQAILIAGSSKATRIVINGLIKVFSLFVSKKILQRIEFVSQEQAMEKVPKESGPVYLGGGGGGINDVVEWTKIRYASLPTPDI